MSSETKADHTHQIYVRMWIVDKRRSEKCTSCCSISLHKRRSYKIMPTQSGVNIEAILSPTCKISAAPAANVCWHRR
ncbi:hypothetical protein TNCT_165521 [Trichonephila clavata]|uniref:Uncharacterized protein n=1 Tax=Trichonephila clavata TaxID=2740835 RepID=A0A8X6HRT1_TRICU|nr:hypothetical protein TNCT_165521 [Trichonephila clavata]